MDDIIQKPDVPRPAVGPAEEEPGTQVEGS